MTLSCYKGQIQLVCGNLDSTYPALNGEWFSIMFVDLTSVKIGYAVTCSPLCWNHIDGGNFMGKAVVDDAE